MPILRDRHALGSNTEVAAVEELSLRNAHFISHRSHRKLAETQRPIYRRDACRPRPMGKRGACSRCYLVIQPGIG
jgi:hypothetical protein